MSLEDKFTTLQVHRSVLARFNHLHRADETNEQFLIRLMDVFEERETE